MSDDRPEFSRIQLVKGLEAAGCTDALVLDFGAARKVLTERRREVLRRLAENQPESIRGLARALDRCASAVAEDIELLFEYGAIDVDTNGDDRAYLLRHPVIVIKPIQLVG